MFSKELSALGMVWTRLMIVFRGRMGSCGSAKITVIGGNSTNMHLIGNIQFALRTEKERNCETGGEIYAPIRFS